MNFENAKKGLKQLYFGEIFELLSAIAMGVMGFAGNMAQGLKEGANYDKAIKLGAQWREAGYHVISMKDDFKTIYGEGVVKTDFTF